MAQSNVKKYLEEREKKQQTAGKVSGGSFGSADKVNAYLQQREERISASKELSEQRQRDIEIGAKAQEMRIANQKAAQERIAAREAERKKASQFSYDEFKAAANRGKWSGGWLLDLLTPSVEPPKNTTLPGYIKPVTDTQSYRDALAALPKLPEKQNPAQSTQFNAGDYLKGALAAGWAGIGSNIAKGVNAALEPLQEAGVDALQWVSKRTALPDISDETANILKGRKALGGLYDWAVDPAERTAAYAQREAAKGGYWAEVGNQVIQSAVQQIPNMIASAATGGGQLAADLGSQAAGGFGAAVLERAKALVSSPAFANSYVQMYGQRFEDAQADGANAYAATLAATITTLMNSAVEMGGGLEGLPFTENGVLDWVIGALEEGREEVIQQVIDQLGQKAYINKNIPWYSATDESAVINPKVLMENQMIGALSGLVIGAPAAALNRVTGATVQEDEEFPENVLPEISDTGMQILQDQNMLGLEEAKDNNGERTWGNYPRFTEEEYASMRRLAEQAYDRQNGDDASSVSSTFSSEGKAQAVTEKTVSPTIERMAQEYGEDASVFKSHYNGSDPAQYKRGFDAMFNAGKSGLSLEMLGGVSDQLTAGMDEATKQSIYTAGRNRAANTTTPGAKNLTTKKLSSEQRTFLRVWDAIGKEYGFEVDLVDDVKDANGAYRSGGRRIVVSANATEGALTQAAGHETVHYLKSVNPEGYSVLEDTVLRYLTDEDSMFDLETAIKERMKEYAGKNPTREEAIEEIVAEAVPTFFSDRAAATEFANRNPTLAEKIRDFFYDFVKKIREIAERYMQSQNRDEIANLLNKTEALTEIARTLDAGLRGAQEKPADKADGEVVTARKKEIKGADDVSKWRPENQFMNEYMTTTERRLFDAHLRNAPKKKWPRSKDGYSIVEAGRALVYTDYAKLNPKVNRVVYFYIDDGTELSGAMHIWRKGEKEGVDNDRNREVVESYYGDGCVVVYHYDDWREAAREDESRKGTDGPGAGGRSQEDGGGGEELKFSLKDNTAFARWFGDSKIVNADGTPKVMYHGSQASFTAFDKKKARSSGLYGRGFYFTDSDTHAGQYGSLYQVYLKVENPLTPDGSTVTKAQVKKFLEAVAENEDDYSIENYGTYDVDEIMKKVYKKDAFAVIQDINATAIGDMVEAVKLFNEVNGTEFDGIVVPTETVVFEPTQIKSATDNVGTYDPEDPDIRFSLKTEEQKEREKADREKNKQMQKAQAEDWQQVSAGEIMVQDLKVDEETVRRQASGALNKGLRDKLNQQIGMAANRILRDTESKYGRDELKKKLHEIVKQYAAHGNVTLAAEELAGAVIDQSVRLKQSEAAEQYADVREQLRNAHISLTETQRQEVANEYGSVDAYRKAVFGTMNVRSEGMTLESLWDELSVQHPEIFPPDTNEAQMPGVIAQFDQMMKPRYENIHGMDTAAAVTDLALRIQGDVLGMVGAKNAAHDLYVRADTFREQVRREYDREIRAQQKARVDEFQQIAGKLKAAKDRGDDEARKKIMAEYRKALNKVDTRTAISEVRAANRVRNEQMKENRERAKLRDSIAKRANSLMNMLVKPEKGKHVPTKLQDSVLKVLEMLDINSERADYHGTETQKSKDYQGSVRWLRYFYDEVWDRQSKGETPEELDGLMMTLSERNIMDIRDAIDIFSLDGGVMVLRDMDSSQLKMVDTLLKTVKQSIESIGKLWRIQRYESIIQLGDASIAEMDSRGPQKITNSMVGGARDFFVLDNMEPVSYGERLGEAGAEVIQSLMDGEKIKFGKIREASEATEKMLKEIGLRSYDIGKWRKHVQVVTLGGKNVRMTDAMLMSLYLTAKRPQGRQHLLGGGFVLRDPKRTGAQEETIRPTEADLAHMAGLLSDKQRQLADRMGEYLSTAVAKWGNDVTQRMYLYDAFTEKHYWPLSSDSSYHKTEEPEADRMFNAIVNASFTKQTNAKANDELVIMDAFDIFGKHIGEMASYAGYAEAMTDTMAWLNYKVRNSETNLNEASVKRSVKKLLGNGGVDYMTKLLQDINGARRETEKTLVDKIGKNAKVAAVVGKISVAIQQPTSIVRAAAEINPWHLIKALRPTKGLPKGKSIGEWLRSNGTVEEMQKWSNLAWWKAHGNYDIGIGKGTDAILWGDTSIKDAVMEKIATQGGLVDPGKMDDLTWAHMWLAVKSEIKRKRKDLEVGSDEFFRAVAERFEYVMDRTQVVDTVMHRSALMRSKNDVTKQLTSFMSEPTKSYNMLMRAVMNLGRNPKDVAAHKRLMRTTAAFAASVVANAAAKGLYEAFRYRDDDEDKLLEYMVNGEFTEDWKKRILINMVSGLNPMENIPIVSTVYEAIPGDRIAKYLGFEQISDYLPSGDVAGHMGLEGISDLIKAGVDALQYMLDDNSGKRTKYGVWGALVKAVSEAFGLPFAGIMTNVETLGRIFDPKWAQSKSVMATMDEAYRLLYDAMVKGDKKKALDIKTQINKGLYGATPKNPQEMDTGVAKHLALNDERVLKAWQMREKGNQNDQLVAMHKEMQRAGFTDAQTKYAVNHVQGLFENQYNDLLEQAEELKGEGRKKEAQAALDEAKTLKERLAKYGMELEKDEEKDMEAELKVDSYDYDHLFAAIRNGDLDDVEGVAEVMEMESEAEDPEKAVRNAVSGEFREEYIDAVLNGKSSKVRDLEKKLDYFGIDAEDRAAWIKKDRYEDLGEALEAGKTGKADEYVEQLRESGVSDDDIASSVSSRFKETYIDLVVKGKDDEAEELAEMLRDLGLVTPKGKNKYRQDVLDDWVEAWYKAQEEE